MLSPRLLVIARAKAMSRMGCGTLVNVTPSLGPGLFSEWTRNSEVLFLSHV